MRDAADAVSDTKQESCSRALDIYPCFNRALSLHVSWPERSDDMDVEHLIYAVQHVAAIYLQQINRDSKISLYEHIFQYYFFLG